MRVNKKVFGIAFGIMLFVSILITQMPGIPNANASESAEYTQAGQTQCSGKIVNSRQHANVYVAPAKSSETVCQVQNGDTCTVNKYYDNENWYQISHNEMTGYINKDYVCLTEDEDISSDDGTIPDEPILAESPAAAPAIAPAQSPIPDPTAAAVEAPAVPAVIDPADIPLIAPSIPGPEAGSIGAYVPDDGTKVIDADSWYIIDNAQFGIDSTGSNARATTDGINDALAWAKEQGYTKIRFADGTYLVQCTWNNRYIAPTDGILVPSGLTLDLGQSTFKMEANDYPAYCIFGIVDQSDVTIKGGTLIGDLDAHVYAPVSGSSTHEWGFGICVSASSNVVIDGVTIKDMTGDGIILEGSYDYIANGGRVSSHVKVLNCDISNCRRQGISVVGSTDTEIAYNTIYDISGTDPQYGIDVEPELDYSVTGSIIHNNTIYGCSGGAIDACKGSDYEIYDNTCTGNIILAVFSSNVKIYRNIINNSHIRVMPETSNVTVTDNVLDDDSWVFFG